MGPRSAVGHRQALNLHSAKGVGRVLGGLQHFYFVHNEGYLSKSLLLRGGEILKFL